MKKIISIFLITLIGISLFGCGEAKAPSEGSETVSYLAALPETAAPGEKIIADFTDRANQGATAEEIAKALATASYNPFDGDTMPVQPGYLNGFTDEVTGFKEGYMFGPIIGSIPFIGYVFVLDDEASSSDFENALSSIYDLRWNICTEADAMYVTTCKNMVCFVMCPYTYEE